MPTGIFELIDTGAPWNGNDVVAVVRVNDPAQSSQGSTRKMTLGELLTDAVLSGSIAVNGTFLMIGGNMTFQANRTIVFSALPSSASGLPSGALWKNGTVVNIVP